MKFLSARKPAIRVLRNIADRVRGVLRELDRRGVQRGSHRGAEKTERNQPSLTTEFGENSGVDQLFQADSMVPGMAVPLVDGFANRAVVLAVEL